MRTLVTGAAGFVGYHVCQRLLARGDEVLGVDSVNAYYDVRIKQCRLERLLSSPNFSFRQVNTADLSAVEAIFRETGFDTVIHLAAQAGVRYSITNPHEYTESNIVGFLNILEGCRHAAIRHLVYASSSSVYGANTRLPFSVEDNVDHPVSLYAATKKANELMAHSYSHLYRLPTTGLRLFTVYGPWGRPDMAIFLFVKAILEGRPIQLFGNGEAERDFTYIDDVVEGIVRVNDKPATADCRWEPAAPSPASSNAPWRIYNVGNHQPVRITHVIDVIEQCLGIKAKRELLPAQPGDVTATFADVDALREHVGFVPNTTLEQGISRFVDWYLSYSGFPAPATPSGMA